MRRDKPANMECTCVPGNRKFNHGATVRVDTTTQLMLLVATLIEGMALELHVRVRCYTIAALCMNVNFKWVWQGSTGNNLSNDAGAPLAETQSHLQA